MIHHIASEGRRRKVLFICTDVPHSTPTDIKCPTFPYLALATKCSPCLLAGSPRSHANWSTLTITAASTWHNDSYLRLEE